MRSQIILIAAHTQMWFILIAVFSVGFSGAVRLAPDTSGAVSLVTKSDIYECPASKVVRNDTVVDIFTINRMPGEPWTFLSVEVPRTYNEFMCGIQNREIAPKCNCGYLFRWRDPQAPLFFFKAVAFDSEIYFIDHKKQIISYQVVPAYSKNVVYSPATTRYVLITQSGIASALGVQNGDPISVTIPDWMYEGTTPLEVDDKVGMHT